MENKITESIDLLNESEMLSSLPRSGFAFLGSGHQSVAEHSYQTTIVVYVLARLIEGPVDIHKVVMMTLFHDLPEARIGDLNHTQKKYVVPQLEKTLRDIEKSSFLGAEISQWIQEFEEGKTLEAQLARDGDQLELLLILKQEEERGNGKAARWMDDLMTRLNTDIGKLVGKKIRETSSDHWWRKIGK